MAKKIFARARLKKGEKWCIDFTTYNPDTGEERRQRKEFGLNDIPDLVVREAVAERLVRHIESFAPELTKAPDPDPGPSLKDAVSLAVAVKQRLPRKNSRRRYITVSKKFLAWAKRLHYADMPVRDFTRKHARAYWDHFILTREYKGKTLNGYLDALRTLWNTMDERELIKENPWEKIKPAREEEKERRPFTPEERHIVATYAMEHDYFLFRAILLQFFCYIRPCELVRLKGKDFDFSKGTVTVQESNAKSYRKAVKTIPRSVLHYFVDGKFERFPANYFVFGLVGDARRGHTGASPNKLNEGRLAKRHSNILRRLRESGALKDTRGLSFYSWKDSGISAHAAQTGPVATKDQAAHRSLDITAIYYHAPEINEAYKVLPNDLFLREEGLSL